MLEAIITFVEINVVWIAVGIFLLTISKIAFNIFNEHKKRKWEEKGFRGALPKIIHKTM